MNARSFRIDLSRRDFVKSAAAGAAAAGVSLWGGPLSCFGTVQAQEPRRGGVYRIMGAGDIRSLDPAGAEGSEDWWSAGLLLFNQLYAYDPNLELYPDLAADLPTMSADGLVYTIPLRRGVKFHNGREMTAEDVAFSLAWQLWPEVYSWGKTYMENVVGYDEVIAGTTKELSGVKVLDPYTIEITLKKPQAVFPSILSMSMNGISPKQETIEAGAEWGKTVVIGTGPFKLVEWKPGQQVIFERHAEYYKEGLPYLDRVELSLNVEPSVQMLRWESGEAEHVHNVPPAEIPRILSEDRFKEARRIAESVGTFRLIMHMRSKPFEDLRVRQAVAMAIDKEFVSRSSGNIIRPLEGIYVPPMLQFDGSFKSSYPYDPEKAKALLAEAGYGNGISGITMFGGVTAGPQLEGMQADLREIGIEVDVVAGTWKDWRDRIRAGEVKLAYYGWAASFPDAYDYVSGWMTCASIETGYNDGSYCNPRIDELVGQAEALPQTDPQRIAAYREIEELAVNTDAAMVGIGTPLRLALSREYVKDEPLNGIYGWPILERAWLAKE
jgi:ABC-type transport system substrate-binding protein